MDILLATSTELEIRPFLNEVRNLGFIEPRVCIAGVGLPSYTHALTRALLTQRPDFVLGVGIAGSFTSRHLPGELVLVKEDLFADLGAGENEKFEDVFSLGLDDPNRHPFHQGMIPCEFNPADIAVSYPQVRGITVNHIRADSAVNCFRKHRHGAEIETQEGAALHYICNMENIPFLHLRAVSNFVGERDKTKWKLKDAVQSLSKGIVEIIEKLTKVY